MENEEIKEQNAKISFDIPAYLDSETNKPFLRSIELPSKKAYSVYKKLAEKTGIKTKQ